MFTGIVDHQADVVNLVTKETAIELTIEAKFNAIKLGESIAVAGVCLTVIAVNTGRLKFDVSAETLALTNLGDLDIGARVNLERAVAAQDLMGGHWMSGHVDGQIVLLRREMAGEYIKFDFAVQREQWLDLLVEKGSVAINGVSLTVNSVGQNEFSVMCIPHTLQLTTLRSLTVNDLVNVEFDMLAKLLQKNILRYLHKHKLNKILDEV